MARFEDFTLVNQDEGKAGDTDPASSLEPPLRNIPRPELQKLIHLTASTQMIKTKLFPKENCVLEQSSGAS